MITALIHGRNSGHRGATSRVEIIQCAPDMRHYGKGLDLAIDLTRVREIDRAVPTQRDFMSPGGRQFLPAALEGALKLKEISYIHAEGYPAAK